MAYFNKQQNKHSFESKILQQLQNQYEFYLRKHKARKSCRKQHDSPLGQREHAAVLYLTARSSESPEDDAARQLSLVGLVSQSHRHGGRRLFGPFAPVGASICVGVCFGIPRDGMWLILFIFLLASVEFFDRYFILTADMLFKWQITRWEIFCKQFLYFKIEQFVHAPISICLVILFILLQFFNEDRNYRGRRKRLVLCVSNFPVKQTLLQDYLRNLKKKTILTRCPFQGQTICSFLYFYHLLVPSEVPSIDTI